MTKRILSRSCLLCSAILWLACKPSPTAPPPAPPPTPATAPAPVNAAIVQPPDAASVKQQQELFNKIIWEGIDRQNERDYAGAIAKYKEALAVSPDNPRAFDEISEAAFAQPDLLLAQQMGERAVQFFVKDSDKDARAATLYRLGRIAELLGQREKAVDAYRRALKDGADNKLARTQLAQLEADAKSERELIGPRPMEGPVANLQAFCKGPRQQCADNGDSASDDGKKPQPPQFSCRQAQSIQAHSAPWQAAALWVDSCQIPGGHEDTFANYSLAVQVGGKWYTSTLISTLDNYRHTDSTQITKLEVRPLLPGEPARVIIQVDNSHAYRGEGDPPLSWLLVAGVGASRKPSLSLPIILASTTSQGAPAGAKTPVPLDVELQKKSIGGGTDTAEFLVVTVPRPPKGQDLDSETYTGLFSRQIFLFP